VFARFLLVVPPDLYPFLFPWLVVFQIRVRLGPQVLLAQYLQLCHGHVLSLGLGLVPWVEAYLLL
jgi:hypothetical protein